MKMWKTSIDAVIMDKSGEHIINTTTQTIVPANSRGDAILVALDMGQAMAGRAWLWRPVFRFKVLK